MFFKKRKEIKDFMNDFISLCKKIEDKKLEVVYYDNGNITHVKSGKIKHQIGWVIKEHKERLSDVQIDRVIYPQYKEALIGILHG